MQTARISPTLAARNLGTIQNFGLRPIAVGVWLIIAYIVLWPYARPLDVPGLLTVTMIPLWFLWRHWQSQGIPKSFGIGSYAPFAIVASIIAALSFLHVMPRAWTLYWVPRVIPQQYATIIFYPVLSFFFMRFLELYGSNITRGAVLKLCLALYLSITLVLYWFTGGERNLNSGVSVYAVYNLTNGHGLILVLFVLFMHAHFRNASIRILLMLPSILAFGGSAQNALSILLYIVAVFLGGSTTILVTVLAMAFVGVAASIPFASTIYHLYPDGGVRAIFWRDAWEGVLSTYFFGVGYGTEIIKNRFFDFGTGWVLLSDESTLLTTGVHSTFVQTLFRLGGLGLATLFVWCMTLIRRVGSEIATNDRILCCWACATLFISFSVNVSLESINFLFLNAFITGLIFADKSAIPAFFMASRVAPRSQSATGQLTVASRIRSRSKFDSEKSTRK